MLHENGLSLIKPSHSQIEKEYSFGKIIFTIKWFYFYASFIDKNENQNKENDGMYFNKSHQDSFWFILETDQTDFEEEAKWENLLSDTSDFER